MSMKQIFWWVTILPFTDFTPTHFYSQSILPLVDFTRTHFYPHPIFLLSNFTITRFRPNPAPSWLQLTLTQFHLYLISPEFIFTLTRLYPHPTLPSPYFSENFTIPSNRTACTCGPSDKRLSKASIYCCYKSSHFKSCKYHNFLLKIILPVLTLYLRWSYIFEVSK